MNRADKNPPFTILSFITYLKMANGVNVSLDTTCFYIITYIANGQLSFTTTRFLIFEALMFKIQG